MMMKCLIILLPLVAVWMIGTHTVNAQPPSEPTAPQSGYEMSWYSIDSGGATAIRGGTYSLAGSIGEPDAGVASGGPYTLNGGFLAGAVVTYNVYMPMVLKG
jgi:hypothetical protein